MGSEENPHWNQVSSSLDRPREIPQKLVYNQRLEVDSKRKMARIPYRHCGKSNHDEKECWWKGDKCLKCGSSKHQIGNCPIAKANPKAPH